MTLFLLLIPASLVLIGATLPYRNALARAARRLGAVPSGAENSFSGRKDGVSFRLEHIQNSRGEKMMRVVCFGLTNPLDPVTFLPARRGVSGLAIDCLSQFSRSMWVDGSLSTGTSYLNWTTRHRLLVAARRFVTVRLGPQGCAVEAKGGLFYTEELIDLVEVAVDIASGLDEQNPDERQRLLAIALCDPKSELRRYALHLAQAQNPSNPLLRQVARELSTCSDQRVALKAAELLGDDGVAVIAHVFATDPPTYLQLEALHAVEQLANESSVIRLLSCALRSGHVPVRIAALEVATKRRVSPLTPQVIDLIGASGVKEKGSISRFLAENPGPGTEDAMLLLLSFPSRRLLRTLLPALADIGTGRAMNRLAELRVLIGREWGFEEPLAAAISDIKARCGVVEGGELSLVPDEASAGALTMTSQLGALALAGPTLPSVENPLPTVDSSRASVASLRPLDVLGFPEFSLRFAATVAAITARVLTYGFLVLSALQVVLTLIVFFGSVL